MQTLTHSAVQQPQIIGHWNGDASQVYFGALDAAMVRNTLRHPIHIVWDAQSNAIGVALGGSISSTDSSGFAVVASLPSLYPEYLGGGSFNYAHGTRFAYVGGAMARGIASADMVIALAHVGCLGMFGAAGLSPDKIEAALNTIQPTLDPLGLPYGSNLIHSPNEHGLEDATIDLYLRRNVRRVSASAFMGLTPAVVRYACTCLRLDADGRVQRHNHLFAKISREEVARHFMSPAPKAILDQLVASGGLTEAEAAIATQIPLATDIIVESDSGGHTDNRPLNALYAAIANQRDRLTAQFGFSEKIRLGAAGSLGTPTSTAAAYALGADFVVVGTVHQACIESGVSDDSRQLLAKAGLADVAMTASADMFELGVKVQVLKRGTMMAQRGNMLYEVYKSNASLDTIDVATRASLEKTIFRQSLDDVWAQTEQFFAQREPEQLAKAQRDSKHKMALVFRWYLGNSSRWPLIGESARTADYQLWCGPAMGAFNAWSADSFFDDLQQRTVGQVALNLLEGAAHHTRLHQLTTYGAAIQSAQYAPQQLLAVTS